MTEQTPGIEQAEEAALALERAIGAPPVVASPAYLDAVGVATKRLEESLGDYASPFASSFACCGRHGRGVHRRGREPPGGAPALG